MIEKDIVVRLKEGVHARPAATLVKGLSQFQSDVTFLVKGKNINAKSILGLMSVAIRENEEIKVKVNGTDEMETFQYIENYLQG
ncbi:HPr family phosphocarrier protein [Sutcliffiella cohnii]